MPLRSLFRDTALHSAWGRFWHLWRPMAGWTLLVWAAVTLLLVPLSSALLGRYLLRGERAVVGNEALLAWLLTPAGLAYALLAAGLAVTAAVVRYAGIFRIVTDDLEGHRATVRKAAFRLWPLLPRLYKLCVAAALAALLLALPLLGGLAAIHALLLGEHDINYYLSQRPAEWRSALALAAAWAIVWLCGAAYVAGRLLLALPAYLDGHRPLPAAMRRAWRLAHGRTARLLRLLAFVVGAWLLTRAVANAAFHLTAAFAVEAVAAGTASLWPLAARDGGLPRPLAAARRECRFVGFSLAATLLTKFYYEDTELHAEAPPPPRVRDLPYHARRACCAGSARCGCC
jgi:glycerophosphoryl diester phosphodiesterase